MFCVEILYQKGGNNLTPYWVPYCFYSRTSVSHENQELSTLAPLINNLEYYRRAILEEGRSEPFDKHSVSSATRVWEKTGPLTQAMNLVRDFHTLNPKP